MANTKSVIDRAYRMIGILGIDDALQAHDYAYAEEAFDALIALCQTTSWGMEFDFEMTLIPAEYLEPMALMLAASIASSYNKPAPTTVRGGMIAVRAVNKPYVRDVDIYEDDYGFIVTDDDAETEMDKRAAFF